MTDLTEEELLCHAQRGSSECFGVLAERYRPALLRFLSARLGAADAEDALQETLLRAFHKIGTFDAARALGPWLAGIAANQAATLGRRRKESAAEVPEAVSRHASPAEAAQQSIDGDELWAMASALLPDRQYQAIFLRYTQDLSVKELAVAMGIRPLHARVLLFRARRKLLADRRFMGALQT